MASAEHVRIAREGVHAWNTWRGWHPAVRPDLAGADLAGAQLLGADLADADLREASLRMATLRRAGLRRANLAGADLGRADLVEADLREAGLRGAALGEASLHRACLADGDLRGASLAWADLSSADLRRADLSGADLGHADLRCTDLRATALDGAHVAGARMGLTILGDVDLHGVLGLEAVCHLGPSTIGIDTVCRSQGAIPESFLRGAGASDGLIAALRALAGRALPCAAFISHAAKDQAFAARLHADLQAHGVCCWLVPGDVEPRVRLGTDEAIGRHDRLILILSAAAVAGRWLPSEVESLLARERREGRAILLPIAIDPRVMGIQARWAASLREGHPIADWSRWQDPAAYAEGLDRLLGDLAG